MHDSSLGHDGHVTYCTTAAAALDAWDTDPRCIIVVNASGSRYAVGHEQPVDIAEPTWHAITAEDLEGRV